MSPSYDPLNQSEEFAQELGRLLDQVELSKDAELSILKRNGISADHKVLEVGCGPGYYLQAIMDAFPGIHLSACDSSPEMAIEGQKLIGEENASVYHCSPDEMLEKGECFDWVIVRYVLQHVEDMESFLKDCYKLLRPSGTLVVIDVDASLWGAAVPSIPTFEVLYRKMEIFQNMQGGNRMVGRKLIPLLNGLSSENARLETFTYHSGDIGIEPFRSQLNPDRLYRAAKAGIIKPNELLVAEVEMESFINNPEAFVIMLGFMGLLTRRDNDESVSR